MNEKALIDFDHHTPAFAAGKREVAADLQERCPVGWTESYGGFWVLSRFEDVSFAAKHPELYSSMFDVDGPRKGVTIPSESNSGGIVEADPPRHTQLRRAMAGWFSPGTVRAAQESMESDAAWFVDQFIESGEADLIGGLADPFPGLVTCRMLGLPIDNYHRYADILRRVTYTPPEAPERPQVDADLAWMVGQLKDFCQERKDSDTEDDVLAHLAKIEVEGRRLTLDELTAEAIILFAAGTDTVTTLTGHTLRHLSIDTAMREWLIEDLSRLDRAFDEFMRYFNPNTGLARTVMEDHTVGGQHLRKGDRVFLWYQAANQDEKAFGCPHDLDLERSPNPHLAFGAGPHRCVGAHLARAQWTIMMAEVLRRIPDYVVDDAATTRYPDHSQISGFITMPATFTPGPVVGATSTLAP